MTETDWHTSAELLARFLNEPATIDDILAASVEAHLVGCALCRGQLTGLAGPVLAAVSWDRVADVIDCPHRAPVEWLLGRVGFSSDWARLLAATASLQAATLAVVAVVAVSAALMSLVTGGKSLFLVVAPLVPLCAVAASFAPVADPAGEAGVATALHGAGLVVRRTVTILAVTFFLLGLAALVLPDLGAGAAAWVLPALALSVAALALGTWLRVDVAVSVLAGGWIAMVLVVWWTAGHSGALAGSATFTTVGQAAAVAGAVVAGVVAAVRRDRFATLRAFR